jgi:phosphoribosylformylglycinamidine synthase
MPNDVWVSAPIRAKPYGAAAALSFAPFWGDTDGPEGMVKLAMAEPITKLVAAGVSRADIVLCDNFYMPRVSPETAWRLKSMVSACAALSRTFGTPFISGKDSSSGSFVGEDGTQIDVPPTLCVFALGRLPDVRKLVPKPFRNPGNALLWVGPRTAELGGSVYWDTRGIRGGRLPDPDPKDLIRTWEALESLRNRGEIMSASAIAEGGLVRRLFEMALGSGLGCRVDAGRLGAALGSSRPETGLFVEAAGAAVIEVPTDRADAVVKACGALRIGEVLAEPVLFIHTDPSDVVLPMDALTEAWGKFFPGVAL